MASSRMGAALHSVAANRGNVPILKLLLGVGLVYFFLIILVMDVQASESYLLQGAVVSAPNWGMLQQPWLLAQGAYGSTMAKAVVWGWVIELVFIVCVVGEVAVHGKMHGWFRTGGIILVCINFWTNVNYGSLPSGIGGQISFALLSAFGVAFLGVMGINMIFSSITEMF
jgi:hypothetical protein